MFKWPFGSKPYQPSGRLEVVLDQLREAGRPCVLLRAGDGRSKVGGLPNVELPNGWPQSKDRPLAFLAQIDLAEMRAAGGPDWLPRQGALLFFYDVQNSPWGFDPADRGGWAVVYQPVAQAISGTSSIPSGSQVNALPEVKLSGEASLSLPAPERLKINLDGMPDQEIDVIVEAPDEHFGDFPAHQLGGFASPIQGDEMELESQLVSNGINCGKPSGYSDPRAKALASGVSDWRLLLQLDSDDAAEMNWGDGGRLYFWVKDQDARNADFSNVWVILQCF